MEERFNIKRYMKLSDSLIHEKRFGDCDSVKFSLKEIRDYLDKCGFKMPQPFYKYDPEDKRTWKYLESQTNRLANGSFRVKQVLNPEFIYNHLV